MNFIRSIVNEQDILLDEEAEEFLTLLESIDDIDQLDEDAWQRIQGRVEVRDMALYRLIVGASNIMKCKNAVELAKQGKTVPAAFVQGYQPVVEMIDDIVTAGPGYVQLLKVLHKRAKRHQ